MQFEVEPTSVTDRLPFVVSSPQCGAVGGAVATPYTDPFVCVLCICVFVYVSVFACMCFCLSEYVCVYFFIVIQKLKHLNIKNF